MPLAPMVMPDEPWLVVVMGVSGSGKTTVGRVLALHLGVAYKEGDALHPASNIAKMARGRELSDTDREPWLKAVADWLREHALRGGVVSCSALRRRYRDVLVQAVPRAIFLHLTCEADTLRRRVTQRAHAFMPASLLESQLSILEPLEPEERGVVMETDAAPEAIVHAFLSRVRRGRA